MALTQDWRAQEAIYLIANVLSSPAMAGARRRVRIIRALGRRTPRWRGGVSTVCVGAASVYALGTFSIPCEELI